MRRAQPWLGTLVEISVVDEQGPDERRIAVAVNAAFAAVARVHRRMSFHDAESDVSAINRLPIGAQVVVTADTAEVLRCAALLESASDGIFNLACGQRLAEWGYLPSFATTTAAVGTEALASTTSLHELPRSVIEVDAQNRVRRRAAGRIDLGGIAKGYAVDCAVAILQEHGVVAGCVNAGGDLRVFGPHAFPVTVRDPLDPTAVGRVLALQDTALATSACYFSRRDIGGVAHAALLNGADGQPVVVDTSASVQAPNCMLADGLTKIVMASGDAHHPLLERFGASAFII